MSVLRPLFRSDRMQFMKRPRDHLMRLLAAFGHATRIMIGGCLLVLGRVATALGTAMHR